VTFLSSGRLWFLALLAFVLIGYVLGQFRRRRYTVLLPTVGTMETAVGQRRVRSHLVAGVFMVALALMVLGFARPAHTVTVSRRLTIVMVVLDTSTSMSAADVRPDRIGAAKAEATRFVNELPDGIRVGLVTFSQDVAIRVPPTLDRSAVREAVASATTSNGTALGKAVYTALDAIHHGVMLDTPGDGAVTSSARGGAGSGIVVISDGEQTVGPPSPKDAAVAAKQAHVAVSTIAVGTLGGRVTVQGEEFPVPVLSGELRSLALATRGRFLAATSPTELRRAYAQLSSDLGYAHQQDELVSVFLLASALLVLLAVVGNFAWAPQVP
jgi:Ca-activated chloride channel family protein